MSKITAIETQKRSGRVNIYLDGIFAVGIDEKLLVDFNLYKDRELSEAEVKELKEAENLSKCLTKAYRFLSFRARSKAEMEKKLLEKFSPETVQKALKKLADYNYINDAEFARAWVETRKSGRGKRMLAFELKNKGVAKETIDEALADLENAEELEHALSLVRTKPKYQNLERNEAYQKVGSFLSRRGYSYDTIKEVINEIAK